MTTAIPLLRLENISRVFQSGDTQIRALDDVSLSINTGEFVAIMGQSGSGKSTLMNILGCLDQPNSGHYYIQGQDVTTLDSDELSALRCNVFGFIFQRYNLLATASAAENVAIPAVYAGMPHGQRQKKAHELLERLGIADREHHRPAQLSGGQQQRVAVARALMNDPLVILADEPTGALDSRSGQDVMAMLADLHREGHTVILITHDETVANHANRIIRISDGKIVSDAGQSPIIPEAAVTEETLFRTAPGLFSVLGETVTTALRALASNIFRTALTLLGIVIGVAAVITMMAVGNGSKQDVLNQISAMGTNLLSIRPGTGDVRSTTGNVVTMTLADAAAIRTLDNVAYVVPERQGRATLRFGNTDYATTIQGVGAEFPAARDWPVASGFFFTDRDAASYAPVIVLGQTVIKSLFHEGVEPIGKHILVGKVPFEVIGVMKPKGAAPWGADLDDAAFIPVTTGMVRLFGQSHLTGMSVKISDVATVDKTEEAIRTLLKERHGTEDFRVRNTASILETATAAQNTLTVLLGAVAAISLLVGGIGVMNIMLVSVTERTREIGIRRAVGARMFDILLQFNIESAIVCIFGGILGVALGLGVAKGLTFFGLSVIFTVPPAVVAFSAAVLTGLIFGFLPARKAARMDPVVALSFE